MIQGLKPSDRVLVLGSSGWFGRELLELLGRRECTSNILAVPGPSAGELVSLGELQDFRATVVLNFAFLTRERVKIEGESEFRRINNELTRRFVDLADSPNVRLAMTVSSGAAIAEADHPYGALKAAEELEAGGLAGPSRSSVILRSYSVSGPHVRRPRAYAFSDLILQALSGQVRIEADRPVFRRYVSVQDALEVALVNGLQGRSGLFETGGELVEVGELAQRVAAVVNPLAEISRTEMTSNETNTYHSDNLSWVDWASDAEIDVMTLDEQIALVGNRLANAK